MEDVLAVYTRPHDPERVLVCLDETSKQLIAETRVPIPMKPGRAARIDYEYERNGTANLFMVRAARGLAPHQGNGPPHRHRLCARPEGLGRCPLSAQNGHHAGPGQSQHPQQGVTL
jgi:hypothetical protein